MQHQFLYKIVSELLSEKQDLSQISLVLPGKRPVVFIKKILEEMKYSGFLPEFITIEDLVRTISEMQEIKGVALWLQAFEVYTSLEIFPKDDFSAFIKWFPTVLKDWDDMMKFSDDDVAVVEYMFDDERIKEWAENLQENEDVPRRKYLNFWKNMRVFLPALRKNLLQNKWATSGMIHQEAHSKIESFAKNTSHSYVFCGFNAFSPVEKRLVRELLQNDKAKTYFHTDVYYMEDEKQEAGKFLRNYTNWKEFTENRPFQWIENEFSKPKNIQVYEVAGNIIQTKILPEILKKIDPESTSDFSDTAVILLDENLLPASLDALNAVPRLNITMGFPLKNLGFSNAVKHIFHLQKQLEKKPSTYYFNDILPILDAMPSTEEEKNIVADFKNFIEEKNIVYLSPTLVSEKLKNLSCFPLLQRNPDAKWFLKEFSEYCYQLKFTDLDDILFENISHFEKSFKIILNQMEPYHFSIKMESLESLVNQIIHSETIDFQGEPLEGLQVMGLLETRLLNFTNVIMLSTNEGKLPLGNSQNTFIPFDVRSHFGMHTFVENDGIYAYHFYRLLQQAKNIHLLYNASGSGVNTGEKSRFITQLEIESPHSLSHILIENTSEPVEQLPIQISKSEVVLEKLEQWKSRVSATHLTTYLYNPIDFYLAKVLGATETSEIEEELSTRNYGKLVHFALQVLYEPFKSKLIKINELEDSIQNIDEAIFKAIEDLKHQANYYEKGINYIHKAMAKKVVNSILNYDLQLVKSGNSLRIIDLEMKFQEIEFPLVDDDSDKIFWYGYIDRIDELNGKIRIIDYKTAKTKDLRLKIEDRNRENFFFNESKKQAIQLCIYNYVANQLPQFAGKEIENGIWSFAEVNRGVVPLEFTEGTTLDDAMVSIRNLILEMLNPEMDFVQKIHEKWNS